ncbi:MAG: SpoIIE family protein phosphatase [Bacteroidia bacterium]|nr:SpoIIE family protein phosphatase [Bacteroidia bacterium]
MKRIVSLIIFITSLSALFAQQGSPLLTHYAESRNVENQSWAICQDENGIMLFAYRKGILAFDGQDWMAVRIPVIPYAMQKNIADGKIYIGGDNNYGYLTKDLTGSYDYVSLSGDSSGIGIITKIIFSDSLAWFYSEQAADRYNLKTNSLELRVKSKPNDLFTGMFVTPKSTYINVLGKGLHRLESDTLFPIVTGYLTEQVDVLFSLPYKQALVLVGLSNGNLSLFDGMKYSEYQIKDDGYLKGNILSEGIALGDTAYAFSTLDGGALVVEKLSGKVLFTINNQNELPDDEVYAIGSDNSGGIWLSHQYGLTRADLRLPVGNFSIYPGLKGNLTSALKYNNELYVATSEGVFYLTEVKSYDEVQINSKSKVAATSSLSGTQTSKSPQEQQGGRKNIFTKIFGKKTGQQQQSKTEKAAAKPATTATQVTRKTISRLKSINYIYKKVEGLNEKCRQIVSTPGGLLASTNRGLFVINNHKAVIIADNRYINFISWQPENNKYFIGANDGYFAVKYLNGKWLTEAIDPQFINTVYSIVMKDNKTLWMGGDNTAYRVDMEGGLKYSSYNVMNEFPQRYTVDLINDTIFLYSESGIYFYNERSDGFDVFGKGKDIPAEEINLIIPLSNFPVIRYEGEWTSNSSESEIEDSELSLLKLFDDVVSVISERDNLWVVSGNNKLFGIDRKRSAEISPAIDVLIKHISNERGTSFNLTDIKFQRGDDVIIFDIIAPGYLKQSTTQYQYFINKQMSDWSTWSVRTHYEKPISKPGDYTLQVRAKDLWGNIGESQSVNFTIKAPFTQTAFFYILIGMLLLFLIILVVRFRERQLHNANRILEEKVKERTAEIEAQKEEITSSIEYASRIQLAMLPVEDIFKNIFSDHFIFYKPRDIVSGDFYWIGEDDKSVFFTVGDCTGHGVPGAFMSTLGISTLNEIISNNKNLQANKVLNLLRNKIMKSLHQTGKEGEAADGMDISFCILNKNKQTMQFAGAYNPLLISQNGELKEYKANRMPIGIYYGEEIPFTNYVINVNKGDVVYIFSDGFTDQFGGPEGAKYKKANLKKLLADIYYRPMIEQQNILETELAKWQGSLAQIDDITIIGVRI